MPLLQAGPKKQALPQHIFFRPVLLYQAGKENAMAKLTKAACYRAAKEDYTIFYRPMPAEWKEIFPVINADILNEFGIHWTVKHSGKMSGMIGQSTSCDCNNECIKKMLQAVKKVTGNAADLPDAEIRKLGQDLLKEDPYRKDVSICLFCFSHRQQEFQGKFMTPPLERNYQILNNGIVHSDWIPVLNNLWARGESFGDYGSANAAENAIHAAEKNRDTRFTCWTKNPRYWKETIETRGIKKPGNLKIMLSSQFINRPANVPETYRNIIDGVFTVFTPEYAEKYGIVINCGARACLSCLRCYTSDEFMIVNELLK